MICILSSGRSGTTYTSNLLNALGVDVGHEKVGERGMIGCNWYEFLDRPKYRGKFTRRLHQVREPIACIRSMLTLKNGIFSRIESVVGAPKLHPNEELRKVHRAASVYMRFNHLMASKASWTYRVEDLKFGSAVYDNLCNIFDVPRGTRPRILRLPLNINTRPKAGVPEVSWEILKKIDESLSDGIMSMAESYGYTYEKQEITQ